MHRSAANKNIGSMLMGQPRRKVGCNVQGMLVQLCMPKGPASAHVLVIAMRIMMTRFKMCVMMFASYSGWSRLSPVPLHLPPSPHRLEAGRGYQQFAPCFAYAIVRMTRLQFLNPVRFHALLGSGLVSICFFSIHVLHSPSLVGSRVLCLLRHAYDRFCFSHHSLPSANWRLWPIPICLRLIFLFFFCSSFLHVPLRFCSCSA
jgi:hypothetical protein